MIDINDYCIREIEQEIILKFKDPRNNYPDLECLLSLRKRMINKKVLNNQAEILPAIIGFNETLREALRGMYNQAHHIWDNMKIHKEYCNEAELTAKCYLGNEYPKLHPIQGDERQELWEAICDSGWNPLYEDGVSIQTLTLPEDKNSFENFIGMDCPPSNWNEGLDSELTKDLHLICQFHNLFDHMKFAITDFIYVREFRTEINIKIEKKYM